MATIVMIAIIASIAMTTTRFITKIEIINLSSYNSKDNYAIYAKFFYNSHINF